MKLNKTYIVTGAGRGIGLELVKQLSKRQCHVIAISRHTSALTDIDHVLPLTLDLTDQNSFTVISSFIVENSLSIDGLVNNAGKLISKPFMELTDDDWHELFDVNLMAPIRLIKSLLAHFNADSHIVNISSMGGFQGSSKYPGLSAYSTAKGAMTTFTECLAVELEEKKIAANCLCLGAVQTDMLAKAFPGYEAPIKADKMGEYIADFLMNSSKVMNGQVVPVSLSNP